MKISNRLLLVTLVTVVAMTVGALAATVLLLRDSQRHAQQHLMRLELRTAMVSIQQRLERSGLAAAVAEARAQDETLRTRPGFRSAELWVVDGVDERVLEHPGLAAGEKLDGLSVPDMLRRGSGDFLVGQGVTERLGVFQTLQPLGLVVGISLDLDEVDAPLHRLLLAIGGINAAASILGGIVAVLFGRWIIRRIGAVLVAVRRIDAGELDVNMPDDPIDDELGHLQRSVVGLGQALMQRTQDQQASRAALAASEGRLRRLAESSLVGLIFWDVDGSITEANYTFLALIGRSHHDLVSGQLNWRTLTPADEMADYEAATKQVIDTGIVKPRERVFLRPDGSRVSALVGSTLLADNSRHGLSIVLDLRDRQQAEADRRARAEAEAANRAKSDFLAGMSHEIRTPMNAILGLTHLVARETHDPRQRDSLKKIDEAGRHLLQVINDILDLSKIESGKLVLEDVEFALDDVAARALDMVRPSAALKGLELVLDTDHLPPRLRGDPTRLTQILINLLSNGVKFTQQGWVSLRAEMAQNEGDRLLLRFEVQDTGVGIAQEHQGLIFDAFEQADGSTTRRHGGTGLGLSLTKHLSALMGGDVGVKSALGRGSTFWFTAWLGAAAAPAEPVEPVALKGLRALLVDDLPEARAALVARLRDCGLDVDELADGAAAVERVLAEAATARPYDLLLLDWRMAPLDGIATLEQIRALLGAATPTAVLATAFDEPAMWDRSQAAGFSAVLIKPVTASSLHDALVVAMRQRGSVPAIDAADPTPNEDLVRQRHAGQRVLLADDNPVNQQVGRELLKTAGLVVETATSGREAVSMVLTRAYQLVLMDVQMPDMDGLTATREIRQRLGNALPIVAMTANAFSEDRAACLAAGMNDHVAKPVEPERLYGTLLRWLSLPEAPQRPARPAPRADPSRLLAALAMVEGFDVDVGLHNVGGRVATFESALGTFLRTYRDGVPDAASSTQWSGAAHALRGSCATIGAVRLADDCEAFEGAIRRDETERLPGLLSNIEERLRLLVTQLGEALAV